MNAAIFHNVVVAAYVAVVDSQNYRTLVLSYDAMFILGQMKYFYYQKQSRMGERRDELALLIPIDFLISTFFVH